jgi:hypothetical protein
MYGQFSPTHNDSTYHLTQREKTTHLEVEVRVEAAAEEGVDVLYKVRPKVKLGQRPSLH